jgi:hypothetical protein
MLDYNPKKKAPSDLLPSYGGLASALTRAANSCSRCSTHVPESFRALLGLGHREVGDEKVIDILWLLADSAEEGGDLTSVRMDTEEKTPASPITGV